MTKTTKKHTQRRDPDEESALQMVTGMLETGLGGLKQYVDATAETIAEARNVEAAESFAHLLTKVAQVAAELRKAESAAAKAAGEVGVKQFIEFIRRASPSDQKLMMRTLQDAQADAARSGLA